MRASIAGSLELLVALHGAGCDVEASAPDSGSRALHLAVSRARLETVKGLVALEVDLDAQDHLGRRVLGCDRLGESWTRGHEDGFGSFTTLQEVEDEKYRVI